VSRWCPAAVIAVIALAPLAAPAVSSAKLVWSDEFNGRAGGRPNPSKWRYEGGTLRNGEEQEYTSKPNNATLDGHGHLVITARKEEDDGQPYTSACLISKREWTYGRFEARIKLPAGRGLWPAFWLVGYQWPAWGEIDMMENLGQDPFTAYGHIHGPIAWQRPEGNWERGKAVHFSSSRSSWHVFGAVWRKGAITLTVDGRPYATYTPKTLGTGEEWTFNKPFFIILNMGVGGDWPGPPNASTRFPAHMLVDWVRAWSPAGPTRSSAK